MNNTMELTEKQINSLENETLNAEACAPTLSFRVIMGMAVLLGGWGATCLINGLVTASGFQEAGRGLVTAITGI